MLPSIINNILFNKIYNIKHNALANNLFNTVYKVLSNIKSNKTLYYNYFFIKLHNTPLIITL